MEYLEAAARGDGVVSRKLTKICRTDEYTVMLMTYLSYHLGIPKHMVMGLAWAFYARQMTGRTITSQNELAVLLHSVQYAIHDLTLEAREMRELAISVADQESTQQD